MHEGGRTEGRQARCARERLLEVAELDLRGWVRRVVHLAHMQPVFALHVEQVSLKQEVLDCPELGASPLGAEVPSSLKVRARTGTAG